MKKFKKIISAALVIATISILLSGCTGYNDMELYKVLSNQNDNVNTMESKTDLSLNITANNLDSKDAAQVTAMLAMVNSGKVSIDAKTVMNTDRTLEKAQVDAVLTANGTSQNVGSAWVNFDATGSTPVMQEIIKYPSIVSSNLPSAYANKPYMVMDLTKMPASAGMTSPIDYKKLMQISKQLTPILKDYMKTYATNFNPDFNLVTAKNNELVGNQSCRVYEVKLNDSMLKSLIKYTINHTANDAATYDMVKQYLLLTTDLTNLTDDQKKQANASIESMFKDAKSQVTAMLPEVNKQVDKLFAYNLLGSKGLALDFYVDGRGYIIRESGYVDISLDALKAIPEVNSSLPKGDYSATLNFNTNITKINEDIAITYPTLDNSNSFNYFDLLNDAMNSIK